LGAWGLLALGSLGGLGCVRDEPTLPVNPTLPAGAEAVNEADLPKRAPKPKTLVAFATVREQFAAEGARMPAQKEMALSQARDAYQQALKQDPKFLPAHLGLARVYETLGDQQRAEQAYQAALKKLPKSAPLCYELGMYYARHKQWDLSLAKLRIACDLAPENRVYANTLGYSLARGEHYDESIAVFKKIGDEAQAHYNVARMLHHLKRDDLSEQQARLALELKPDLGGARELLAELHGQPAAPAVTGEGHGGADVVFADAPARGPISTSAERTAGLTGTDRQ
jgi:tetratricopeptide (TPR) repeat protein